MKRCPVWGVPYPRTRWTIVVSVIGWSIPRWFVDQHIHTRLGSIASLAALVVLSLATMLALVKFTWWRWRRRYPITREARFLAYIEAQRRNAWLN